MNRQQEIPVSRETLRNFTNKVRWLVWDLPEHDWSLVLESLKNMELELEKADLFKFPDIQKVFNRLWERITGACRNARGVRVEKKVLQFLAASLLIYTAVLFQPMKNNMLTTLDSTVPEPKLTVSEPELKEPAAPTEIMPKDLLAIAAVPETKVKKPATHTGTLPEDLLYKEVDTSMLRHSLNKRNSTLADEPYLSSIIQVGKEFDVNPLFLLAITGQEQAFVPRQDKDATRIANNPFNVYHSWTEYNTNIQDSARIAAITIANLRPTRPETVDPVVWINQHYCEDKKWWMGVSKFFIELSKEVEVEG